MNIETFKVCLRAFFPGIKFFEYEHFVSATIIDPNPPPVIYNPYKSIFISKFEHECWLADGKLTSPNDLESNRPSHIEPDDLIDELRFYHDSKWEYIA